MDNTLSYRLTLKDFFRKGIQGAIKDTERLDGGMNKLNQTLNRVGTGIASAFAVSKVIDFEKSVIESLKNYQYFSASLRTLMYGDKQSAKALEGQLTTLATTTPFQLTEVQDASKQLLAYGFEAGKITKNIKMLGDVASGVGAPLSDIIYLYGTLRTQGRAYTKDIMQFTSRGIPIIGQLAKQFGVTESEVQKLVEAGKVGFPQIERAFRDMTSSGGQFFGMMDEQSKTVGGKLSNLADSWEQLKVSIGKSQTGIISDLTNWASMFINKLQSVIEKMNQMDEAFANTGKNLKYSRMERFNDWLFMGTTNKFVNDYFTGGKGRMEMLQRSLEGMYVSPSKKNEASALQSQKLLAQFASNYIGSFQKKEIGQLEYDRGMALIKYAQSQIEGNIKLFRAPANKELAKKGIENIDQKTGSSTSSNIASATEVYGARPQNINITLDRLGDVHINTTNVVESAQQTKEIFTKQLLEVLNDANLIASR